MFVTKRPTYWIFKIKKFVEIAGLINFEGNEPRKAGIWNYH